jgi:cytochrome c oxidase subunit I
MTQAQVPLLPEPTVTYPRLRTPEGLLAWVASVDHKQLGVMYILASAFFFLIGGIEAELIRIQLARPENSFLSPTAYNQIFTMHGVTMIFLVVMPLLFGFVMYFLPLMIGARDMAFPRLNALSFWVFLFGGLLLYYSFFLGGAPSAGWFAYAPLSDRAFTSGVGENFYAAALLEVGIGSVATAVNIIATVFVMRIRGMTMRRLPLFVWMSFVNAFIILFALASLNAALVMLLVDRLLNGHFFTAWTGGDPLMWQHYFWAFGHPEVYIMILPAWGMISEIIPVFSRKPIFGYGFVAGSTVAIAFLSFAVYAHHMFAVGLGIPFDTAFGAASMLIAIPTGVKIFNWIATAWGGKVRLTTSMMFALAFIVLFTMGGITGVTFATVPVDWQMEDSYYVVAHFHYVLFGGTLFAILAGLYYWFPKMTGRLLSEAGGKVVFWLIFIGFNTTFLIQHLLGIEGMSRRVWTYPDLPGWGVMNLISTIGSLILVVGFLVLAWNLWAGLRHGKLAGDNPWDAWTLEWATTSPPPPYNFVQVPPVHGRRPLWDLAHPEDQDSQRGRKPDGTK